VTRGDTSSDCRILYLVGQLGAGGSERQLLYLLQNLDREKYPPAVAVWHYSPDDMHVAAVRALGVPLLEIAGQSSRMSKVLTLRGIIERLKPEVIHSYSFHTNAAVWLAARGTPSVCVGSIRNDFILDKEDAGPWLGKPSARWPRYQICNSFAAAENVNQTRGPFVPRAVSVVRNGLDLASHRNMPPPADGSLLILGVGSLFHRKRWDRLLIAAATLKRRGFGFRLHIAGDGPLRGSLQSQARELGIGDRVRFLGTIDGIPQQFQAASLVAHTAESEGCPNAVMEAMACGRPVVATDSGDVPLLVDHERTGFVVKRGDDESLVSRLQTLIENAVLRREMGVAARLKAEREFGLPRLVTETLAAYRDAGWQDSAR